MNERIDHATKSQKIWEHVEEDFISEEGWTEATAIMGTLDALRHATLALVEQQRIANLIALHRHEVKYDIGSWSRLYDTNPSSGAVLKRDIAEGLGIA